MVSLGTLPPIDSVGCVFFFNSEGKGLRTTREFHVTRLSKDVQRDKGILPIFLAFFVFFSHVQPCGKSSVGWVDNSRNCSICFLDLHGRSGSCNIYCHPHTKHAKHNIQTSKDLVFQPGFFNLPCAAHYLLTGSYRSCVIQRSGIPTVAKKNCADVSQNVSRPQSGNMNNNKNDPKKTNMISHWLPSQLNNWWVGVSKMCGWNQVISLPCAPDHSDNSPHNDLVVPYRQGAPRNAEDLRGFSQIHWTFTYLLRLSINKSIEGQGKTF